MPRGPPASAMPGAPQGFEGLTQRIADYQAEREARAAAARAAEEEQKLRECSFAPDINRRRVQAKVGRRGHICWQLALAGCAHRLTTCPPHVTPLCLCCLPNLPLPGVASLPRLLLGWFYPWQGPVVVHGLDRVLELKQLAERQRAEAAKRAARVFHANPRPKQGATVPRPFQLAGHALLEVRGGRGEALAGGSGVGGGGGGRGTLLLALVEAACIVNRLSCLL